MLQVMKMVVVKPYSGAIDMDALIEDLTADHLSITKPASLPLLLSSPLLPCAVSRAAPSTVRCRSAFHVLSPWQNLPCSILPLLIF